MHNVSDQLQLKCFKGHSGDLMATIEIPTRNSSEVVVVHLDDLPEAAHEITDLLAEENASLDLYIIFAVLFCLIRRKNTTNSSAYRQRLISSRWP